MSPSRTWLSFARRIMPSQIGDGACGVVGHSSADPSERCLPWAHLPASRVPQRLRPPRNRGSKPDEYSWVIDRSGSRPARERHSPEWATSANWDEGQGSPPLGFIDDPRRGPFSIRNPPAPSSSQPVRVRGDMPATTLPGDERPRADCPESEELPIRRTESLSLE